ncbi:MAG: type II toxin-antitoxin system prevent-host-death family antitoxin [Chloroflexi bacterium]|nr:type II toxin-antitoxin system prevent-host-death family antitoxin [Chloroflexota bacterium]
MLGYGDHIRRAMEVDAPTIGVQELKAGASELLRLVEEGEEFVVTRHGKPCARLVRAESAEGPRAQSPTLLGIYRDRLPSLTWEDFQEAKRIWEPKPLPE